MSTDANRTTEYGYTLEGQLAVLIARNSVTGDQVTRWHYGTTLAESGVASNSLVRAKVYPESDDAGPGLNGPDGVYDRVEYRYNRQGELIEQKDQNGTVHAYEYDRLGRLVHDRVTALGTGIDGAVRRVSRGYDRAGRLESVGSWSEAGAGAGQVVNQLRLRYNGFGQLIEDSQNHDGAVAPGSTPAVRYQYANGSNRHIRRLKTTYPGGREIGFDYGAAGEADDKLGRVQAIRDASDADKVLARYTRRGLSSTMRIEYPTSTEVSPLEMTYIKQPGEPDGDAGDQYTGQDRFNRIIDIRWLRTPTFHVDRFQYGFDRAGNRLWRRNVVAASNWDELYSYDGLYQLPERQRGTLNGTHTGLTGVVLDKEQFTYDPTGNWDRYLTQGTTTLDQSRTHNRANEITEIAGSEAAAGYDRAGNMTRMPRVWSWALPQETTWDAWNRLVKISEGATTVGRYAYDGLTRRVWKESVEDGTLTRRHFYYSDQWQVLEERTGTSVLADRRFVWGLRYIDDLILRDRVTSPTDTERLYVTHDQWHVTATVGTDGLATERYAYRAFGATQFLAPDFSPRSASISGWETTYGAYRYDGESGLNQVAYRYLHPILGRWMSRDIGSVMSINDYPYVKNRTPNQVDPSGLTPMLTKTGCDADIARAEGDPMIKALKREIANYPSCIVPTAKCQCCGNPVPPPSGTSLLLGYFDNSHPGVVVICHDRPASIDVLLTYRHELTHAKNNCVTPYNDNDCNARICDELNAYGNSGECTPPPYGGTWADCIIEGAVRSATGKPGCPNPKRLRKLAAERFWNCVNPNIER